MRLSDRFLAPSSEVWRGYWRHRWIGLREQGFSAKNDLYRLFGAEVFHDGGIEIHAVDLAQRTVSMRITNVYAINQLGKHIRRSDTLKLRKRFCRADFATKIDFFAVSSLKISMRREVSKSTYYCSELKKHRGLILLKIYSLVANDKPGYIEIAFERAKMQDIAPRIQKYFSKEVKAAAMVSPVSKSDRNVIPGFQRGYLAK